MSACEQEAKWSCGKERTHEAGAMEGEGGGKERPHLIQPHSLTD
jgi:hypothetical protein